MKAVSPLYAPVSGEVVEVNSDLPNQLETLASDPYGAGWLIKLKVTDPGEVNKLMDHSAYERQCSEAGH